MERCGLQIIITSGPEAPRRAALGFAAAAAALAAGTAVVVFLALNGARWAFAGEGEELEMSSFQQISELIEVIQSAGGQIEICSNCVNGVCDHESTGGTSGSMRSGVTPAGLTTVAIRMNQMPTVTF